MGAKLQPYQLYDFAKSMCATYCDGRLDAVEGVNAPAIIDR